MTQLARRQQAAPAARRGWLRSGLCALIVTVTTLAGGSATASEVTEWNEVALAATRGNELRPPVLSRALNIVHTAMYDAWAAYDANALGTRFGGALRRPPAERSAANKLEAVSYAAYRSLLALEPGRQALLDAHMAALGFDPGNDSRDPATPAGIGNLVADAVLEERAADGANADGGFADTTGYVAHNSADPNDPNSVGGADFDPNHWQPLRVPSGSFLDANGVPAIDPDDDPASPRSYTVQSFMTPQWRLVTPFALLSSDEFRPSAPPQKGDSSPYVDGAGRSTTNDQAWHDQHDELIGLSAGLTPEHKAIVEYWADGPRGEMPPGHLNQLAQGLSIRDDHSLDEDIQFFFALNNALLDAGIAAWDAKAFYDFIRPISAIRDEYFGRFIEAWGGPNQGTRTIPGETFRPYQPATFVTPSFPEYVSGHSTFTAAAATVFEKFTGRRDFFDGTTRVAVDLDHEPGPDLLGQIVIRDLLFEDYDGPEIVLRWENVWDLALESGNSRLYGGIHNQDGNLRGLALGRLTGTAAYNLSRRLISGEGRPATTAAPRAAILPTGRSVRIGTPASAFATIINTGEAMAHDCEIVPTTVIPADFRFQATDPSSNTPSGIANAPVDIPPGTMRTFVFAFTPEAPFAEAIVSLAFTCSNAMPAPVTHGLTDLLLSASVDAVPDIVALAATQRDDGIVTVPAVSQTGVFAVAAINLGSGDSITASVDTGDHHLPVGMAICETDPASGDCLAPPSTRVITPIAGGATASFGIFVTGQALMETDMAEHRVFVRFADSGGTIRGATSVAVVMP